MEALGHLEAEVMEVVWRHAPVTAREVCDRMSGKKERAYTTIMTTMDRLHRKGLMVRKKDGLAWRYAPAMSKSAFERSTADALAAGILRTHGEVGLAAFVDAAAVDDALLERLSRLISERKKGPKR